MKDIYHRMRLLVNSGIVTIDAFTGILTEHSKPRLTEQIAREAIERCYEQHKREGLAAIVELQVMRRGPWETLKMLQLKYDAGEPFLRETIVDLDTKLETTTVLKKLCQPR